MWKVTVLWQQNVCLPSSVCGSCVAPLRLSDIINELAECQSKCCNHRAEEPTSQGERDGAVFIVTMTDPNLCNSRRWMWHGVISPDPSNSSGTSSFHYFARWGPRDSLRVAPEQVWSNMLYPDSEDKGPRLGVRSKNQQLRGVQRARCK